MRLFGVVADMKGGVKVKIGRTFHQDRKSKLAHEELLAVVRVRNKDDLAIVAHGTNDADVVVVVVAVGIGGVIERPSENAFAFVLAEDFSGRAADFFQDSVVALDELRGVGGVSVLLAVAGRTDDRRLSQGGHGEDQQSSKLHLLQSCWSS